MSRYYFSFLFGIVAFFILLIGFTTGILPAYSQVNSSLAPTLEMVNGYPSPEYIGNNNSDLSNSIPSYLYYPPPEIVEILNPIPLYILLLSVSPPNNKRSDDIRSC